MSLTTKMTKIDAAVFSALPNFSRLVAEITIDANSTNKDELEAMLQNASIQDLSTGRADDAVIAWEAAYRSWGINPNKFPPSLKALRKRVKKTGTLPFINPLVAITNIVSLRIGVPCGGDDVKKIQGNCVLGLAGGTETFQPLGNPNIIEVPDKGEIVYKDDGCETLMCRRFNWRNGHTTRLTEQTTKAVVNLDFHTENCVQELEAQLLLAGLVHQFLDGSTLFNKLHSTKRHAHLSF